MNIACNKELGQFLISDFVDEGNDNIPFNLSETRIAQFNDVNEIELAIKNELRCYWFLDDLQFYS